MLNTICGSLLVILIVWYAWRIYLLDRNSDVSLFFQGIFAAWKSTILFKDCLNLEHCGAYDNGVSAGIISAVILWLGFLVFLIIGVCV